MYVVFKAGNSHRVVDAELRDILPFGRFRRLVFDRLDVRTVYRDGRWFRDVIAAAK